MLVSNRGDRDWGSICGYPGIDPSPSQRIQMHGAGLATHEEIMPRAGLRLVHVRACKIGQRHFKDQGLFTAAGNDSIDSTRIRELSYGRPPNQRGRVTLEGRQEGRAGTSSSRNKCTFGKLCKPVSALTFIQGCAVLLLVHWPVWMCSWQQRRIGEPQSSSLPKFEARL